MLAKGSEDLFSEQDAQHIGMHGHIEDSEVTVNGKDSMCSTRHSCSTRVSLWPLLQPWQVSLWPLLSKVLLSSSILRDVFVTTQHSGFSLLLCQLLRQSDQLGAIGPLWLLGLCQLLVGAHKIVGKQACANLLRSALLQIRAHSAQKGQSGPESACQLAQICSAADRSTLSTEGSNRA